mgnify:CR=1 FL=1
MNLTVANVANNYTSKSTGKKGTLVFFNEVQKDGDFKGKPFTHWSDNPDFVMRTDKGWTLNEEDNRVVPPIVTHESLRKAELLFMHELGMEIRL